MATTVPDGIWSPDDGTAYNLPVNLAAMADTVQAGLNSVRGSITSKVGTNAERLAIPSGGLFEGLEFWTTDTRLQWVYSSGVWVQVSAAVRLTKTTVQSTSSSPNTYTPISWDVETFDTANMHAPGLPSRVTVPSSGLYSVSAVVGATLVPGSGSLNTMIYVNGVAVNDTLRSTLVGTAQAAFCTTSDMLRLNAGAYIEIFATSNLASVPIREQNSNFAVARIGF